MHIAARASRIALVVAAGLPMAAQAALPADPALAPALAALSSMPEAFNIGE